MINPATGEVLLRVPRSGPADIDAAVRAATEAFPGWRDTSPVARADLLRRWAALCREHVRDIEILEQMEVGHPRWGPSPVPSVILSSRPGWRTRSPGRRCPPRPGRAGDDDPRAVRGVRQHHPVERARADHR